SPVYLLSLVCSLLPRPPRSPLFPYTTLFRSRGGAALRAPMLRCGCVAAGGADERAPLVAVPGALRLLRAAIYGITPRCPRATARSEERRVGKERGSRWSRSGARNNCARRRAV